MDLLSLDFTRDLLSEAGKVALKENVLITAVVLWTVRGHFKKLEDSLAQLVVQVGVLSQSLLRVEERVQKLEKPKDG